MNKHIKLNFFTRAENVLNKSKKSSNINVNTKPKKSSLKLLGRGFQENLQKLQGIVIVFGCSTEVEDKSLLRKIQCTWDLGTRDQWARTDLITSSLRVPEGITQASKGKKQTCYLTIIFLNHSNGQHDTVTLKV